MDYRQLGRSGLRVSTLTLGTMSFGDAGEGAPVGSVDLASARRQVDQCLDAGINLIETADVYGRGRSEEIVGEALEGRRDQVLLATKARMTMGEGPNDAELSRHHLVAGCEASLRPLRTGYIDVNRRVSRGGITAMGVSCGNGARNPWVASPRRMTKRPCSHSSSTLSHAPSKTDLSAWLTSRTLAATLMRPSMRSLSSA
jgi:hypothetical protein